MLTFIWQLRFVQVEYNIALTGVLTPLNFCGDPLIKSALESQNFANPPYSGDPSEIEVVRYS